MYVPIATPSETTVSAAEAARPAFFHFAASWRPHTSLLFSSLGASTSGSGVGSTTATFSGPSTCVTMSLAVERTLASLTASALSSVFTDCDTVELLTSITLSLSAKAPVFVFVSDP